MVLDQLRFAAGSAQFESLRDTSLLADFEALLTSLHASCCDLIQPIICVYQLLLTAAISSIWATCHYRIPTIRVQQLYKWMQATSTHSEFVA